MITEFKYKGVHTCRAVLITCIDFRFWEETINFVENNLGIKDFDHAALPGAAKAINESTSDGDIAMKCISVSCDLHHAKEIIIVNHDDCGAYGGSGKFEGDEDAERKFHEEELKKAKEKLAKKYPQRKIITVFANLVNNRNDVDFNMVG